MLFFFVHLITDVSTIDYISTADHLHYFLLIVAAISNLHTALGLPILPGWGTGQDPCGDAWQGVVCNDSIIIKMYVNFISGIFYCVIL